MDQKIKLADDLEICRVLNGMWQVSGAHGYIDPQNAIDEMVKYHNSGFTTWDLADIYGPAESFIGKFRAKLENLKGIEELENSQALTKFVPNPGPMSKSIVEYYIDQSLQKMNTAQLDLIQFHWWDYNDPSYIDALVHLSDLRDKGKIKHVGLTNFDTERLQIITEQGIRIVSNQVQYSILDNRPEKLLTPFCQKNGIQILSYGTLLGGFLSEKYLGTPEPLKGSLDTASLRKYYNMIVRWGGWELFQELLQTLSQISQKHQCSIANVATSYILQKPAVVGVIIGARLGISEHIDDNKQVFRINLDSQDKSEILSVTEKSNDLFELIGDCGSEYR
ncbi:MAG: aldo/keto reductase [Nitrosopumilaceae archaeon]|uniref:Aldo/keto reductase n=3 Tax=Candidatus Nitrosomaritimum aestuariumsis TaxID=3342354 RepID=A0AC60VYA8_9ARCH|nr:aldo/keto reductase [Nitrosopumilaceae archaeon]MBA4464020.1 aldo/keto reductase [Nitrosopumilaceae archaeon]